jgi:hypothetical protein
VGGHQRGEGSGLGISTLKKYELGVAFAWPVRTPRLHRKKKKKDEIHISALPSWHMNISGELFTYF